MKVTFNRTTKNQYMKTINELSVKNLKRRPKCPRVTNAKPGPWRFQQ